MIRQYAPTVSRFRNVATPRGDMQCGVLPVGTICRPQDAAPVIIEAWMPRDYAAIRINGQHVTKRIRGGHLAQVRCLATSRRFTISDAWLIDTDE